MNALPAQLPDAELSAVVQRDATGELPSAIAPLPRPVGSGVVRAALGALPVGSCDVFHGLDVDLPVRVSAATVATVHDLSVLDMPSASSRFRAFGESLLVRNALRTADLLVAVSRFTAERIKAVSGRDAAVVELAPASWARPPAEEDVTAIRTRYRLPERFVLQVGTVEPRKNVHLIADAARQLDIACVLAGAGSTGPDAPPGVLGLGYVDVADLPALYAAATVTTYASHYEGFGLPPVEAMACGGAVVAGTVGALPDVTGDGAVLVATQRVDDWVSAMRPVVADPEVRTGLVDRAVQVTREMTWGRTAERTVAAYRAAGMIP